MPQSWRDGTIETTSRISSRYDIGGYAIHSTASTRLSLYGNHNGNIYRSNLHERERLNLLLPNETEIWNNRTIESIHGIRATRVYGNR
jgi:hypothetical protein